MKIKLKQIALLVLTGLMIPSVYSKPLIPYKVSFKSNGMNIQFSSNRCDAFSDKLYKCRNVSIKIRETKQILKLDTAWINSDYTVYTGRLGDTYADDKYSMIFSDIDGDGTDDLIIQTGKEGAYGGPSYSVYLYKKGKFTYNEPLSRLTVGANFLFRVDNGKLSVDSTSGCCEYNRFVYRVHNGNVGLLRKDTEICESASGDCRTESIAF